MLVDKPQSSDSAAKEIREISDRHAVGTHGGNFERAGLSRAVLVFGITFQNCHTRSIQRVVQIAIDHPDPETRLSRH